MKSRIAKTFVAIAATFAATGAWADRRWSGNGETTDWNDADNWDTGTGAHVFRHSKQAFTKKTVSFSSLVELSQQLWFQNNEASSADTEPIVFTADVAANGLNLAEKLNIASNSDGNGHLEVASGTHTFGGSTEIGGGSCTGTFRQSGGTVYASGWFCVGLSGNGYHYQTAGSFIHSGNVAYIVGQGTGNGTSTVSGGTMTLNGVADTSGYSVYVGENAGTGVWNLSGNAVVTTAKKVGLGKSNTAGRGYLNVADNAVLAVNDELWVGLSGIGHLTVSNNASVSCTDLVLSRNDYDEADENASTATISGGEVTCTKLWLPYGKNRKATMAVTGGQLDITENSYVARGVSSEATLSVSNGLVVAYLDPYIGQHGVGTLEIFDGGVFQSGTASATRKWIKIGSESDGNGTITIHSGGELRGSQITPGSGTSTVNFNGGKFTVLYGEEIFPSSDKLTVNLNGKGGTIDTNGSNASVADPLLGTGSLTKQGSGTLKLSGANTYTGDTIVEEGTLTVSGSLATTNLKLAGGTVSGVLSWNTVVVTNGVYHYSELPSTDAASYEMTGGVIVMTSAEAADSTIKKVVVKGGTLVVDGAGNTYAAGDAIAINAATLDGVTAGDVIRVAGTTLDWTISVDGKTATASAPASATNIWVGGASGSWEEVANWKYGVPTSSQDVSFDGNVTIVYSASVAKVAKTVTLNNANLTIKASNYSGGFYAALQTSSLAGSGTLTLDRAGLVPTAAMTIPSTIKVVIKNNDVNDSYIGSNSYVLTIDGEVNVVNLLHIWNAVINGPITGSGTFGVTGKNVKFAGDNSGFRGTVTTPSDQTQYFLSAASGSENAVWNINGDLRLDFEGVIKFGRFSNSGQKMYYCNHEKAVTIEIGALGGESSFGNLAFFGDLVYETPNMKLANYTIKKVGSGKLTYASYGIPAFDVVEGELALAPTLYNDSHAVLGVDSIIVRTGAILSGALTGELAADSGTVNNTQTHSQTISELTLEPGAIVRQTIVQSGEDPDYTYSCPTLAVSGTASVNGALFDLVDSYDFLANAVAGEATVFTPLSSTTVAGTPVAYRDIPMATAKWAWLPKNTGSAVVFKGRNTRSGFVIFVQ